jgi:hypothetical protein
MLHILEEGSHQNGYVYRILNYSGKGKGFLNKFGNFFAADCTADEWHKKSKICDFSLDDSFYIWYI